MNYSESRASWRRLLEPIDGPIRSELFSVERLEQHAETLAAAQRVSDIADRGRTLSERLADNARVITDAYRAIVQATRAHRSVPPAAEWLLDNYHIVDEQIREIRDDLPPGYYRKLPKLIDGHLKGYPRVYGIAWAVVAHTDSALDVAKLVRFVESYQRVQPLTIGELWAIAITLRITLVENLRRVAESILTRLEAAAQADAVAERILGAQGEDPPAKVLASLDRANWSQAFAVQLVLRLRDRDPDITPALRWLNARLAADGTMADAVVRKEVQQQSATNVTVRNVITSMRLISAINWPDFVESVSLVDAALRAQTNFAAMDFATRDLYRRAIETLALEAGQDEEDVARFAAERAANAAKRLPQSERETRRECDPGYYLIAEGRPAFERDLKCRVHLGTRLFRRIAGAGIVSYVAMIGIITLLLLAAGLIGVGQYGVAGWVLAALALTAIVPASDLATAIVNRVITHRIGAMQLPGLELRDGIPPELRTLIVVPTLLTSAAEIAGQVAQLEVHYLANPEDNLHFALLSDWKDAPAEKIEGDDALLAAAVDAMAALNGKYPRQDGAARFLLLHRRRMWNDGERKWLGWERKRGKLHELNRLLRGAADTTFLAAGGAAATPKGVRYVITLDADTRLPIGAARRLVGKIAHPLNRPCLDGRAGRVTRGHAILQPRVTSSLPLKDGGSLFQRVFSGPNGLDPYAIVVSDVYQDLYEEGSFVGKGIYDVDVFESALDGRIPVNTVLSHDLLEGIFARAGLASDIEVVEEFPSRYDVAASRTHRWVRGDWQLLPWIFANGPRAARRRTPVPLGGRWKLIDNLRRSLSAPAMLLSLLLGWLLPLDAALVWTVFIVLLLALPPMMPAVSALLPRRVGVSLRNHWRGLARDVELGLLQTGFLLVFLAHQAWLMVDAVGRTVFRLFVRRRRLLEWVTTAQAHAGSSFDPRTLAVQIAASAVSAGLTAAVIVRFGDATWPIAAPFLALWLVSPLAAYWASLPPSSDSDLSVGEKDAQALRLVARRTWRFFETFVTAADNFLPPDNFQEDPAPVVAHRTSPTNIGLYLLSVIAARDFGWIGTSDAAERLENTFATLDRLERFLGHFYNWYATQDLRPLEPRYISTVDSGNLAGHLIALAHACREFAAAPLAPAWRDGIEDALALVRESVGPGAAPSAFDDFASLLHTSHAGVFDHLTALEIQAEKLRPLAAAPEAMAWVDALLRTIDSHKRDAQIGDADAAVRERLHHRLDRLAARAMAMFEAMEFGFLLDRNRLLLAIGYRANDSSLDANFYDMLASEARLASFIAIAKGDVPVRHWFRLGRTLTPLPGGSALISWSGSMFEYLMPSLVMRAPAGSLLAETNRLIVRRQRAYGAELGVPWGISESAFSARDIERTYQYSSFGVPDLGYKRGLSENTVIAPYATGLAAMVDPAQAARNFAQLSLQGGLGAYGWYEALDYTPARLPEGAHVVVVRCYMAHHQAMSLVAIANALQDGRMRARFHAEPLIQAAELLLQERMPRDVVVARPPPAQVAEAIEIGSLAADVERRYTNAHSRLPRTHLLSNGAFSTMLTAAGSGYTRWRDVAVTRWREDGTCDNWGSYCFLRDLQSGETWSAGYQPAVAEPDDYVARFSEDRAEIVRRDGGLTTTLEVLVSPEDNAELRLISVSNNGPRAREIELTSYAELALARQADDMAHPAFAKLFVQTEFVPHLSALLATRRRRSDKDPAVWAAHLAVVEGNGEVQFETDRARFLGRGQSVRSPAAIAEGWPLSNTAGPVLDPIFSLRRRVRVAQGATARVAFWTVVADSRGAVMDLVEKYSDAAAVERVRTLAWTQAQVQLQHQGCSIADAHLFQRLANHILYSDSTLRPPPETIRRGVRKASTLWAHGISGDLPIVLVRVAEDDDLALVRQVLRAQEYWRTKQLAVDLVILNERASSYIQDFQGAIDAAVRMNRSLPPLARSEVGGGVFVLRADLASGEVCEQLQAVARAVLRGQHGTLADQINAARERRSTGAPPVHRLASAIAHDVALPRPAMEYFNGLGGFVSDGREYLTLLENGERTPAPWINVIANPDFGFQTSADGGGFTWTVNSQQNQITPWSNDPVGDACGEAIYIRDEDTGMLWCPAASPIREKNGRYAVRHGQGYSRFEHNAHGIGAELTQFAALSDTVKIARLKLTNLSGRERRLSVTAYVEWVLGSAQRQGRTLIVTEIDPESGALLAQNRWNNEFGERVAFLDMQGRQSAWTGDRTEFIGRDGATDRPVGLVHGTVLSNRCGGGFDPCGVLQTRVKLSPVGSAEVVILLGQAASREGAQALAAKYRDIDLDATFDAATRQWDDILGTVQVRTPDRALDILTNRWLLYQTLGCRIWARAGFYQASGAYGFRDQLQDTMALCVTRPDIARRHLLRAAARQFPEGDVQHWWLAETERGVRTRISDDRVWLAHVVAHYVRTTGDTGVLDEQVPFLEGPMVQPGEHDAFFQPAVSPRTASLFEHVVLALDASLATGTHGLPLMGTGDWNDGMDRVGEGGKGESVWLGWFLYSALMDFSPIAERRGAQQQAQKWRQHAAHLKAALEDEAWDGDWYRRAFFDDGTPLGSVASADCRIDSIAQSWSVISGAAEPARAARAMAALDKYLVQRDQKLSLLFTPPFDQPAQDPGYIKGYPPGIRENGGQYTHAAIWAAQAFALLGDGDRAHELLAMLNPIYHSDSPAGVQRYKVEPYVVAADVYSMPPHVGRGGWTWYTGSAAWLYRIVLEHLLGFKKSGDRLTIDPCIPRGWPKFEITYKHGSAQYDIIVENPLGVCRGVLALAPVGAIEGCHLRVLLLAPWRSAVLRATFISLERAAQPRRPARVDQPLEYVPFGSSLRTAWMRLEVGVPPPRLAELAAPRAHSPRPPLDATGLRESGRPPTRAAWSSTAEPRESALPWHRAAPPLRGCSTRPAFARFLVVRGEIARTRSFGNGRSRSRASLSITSATA
ncbi:MAG: glucoamylase family protein [Rhizomicrobium sp.]